MLSDQDKPDNDGTSKINRHSDIPISTASLIEDFAQTSYSPCSSNQEIETNEIFKSLEILKNLKKKKEEKEMSGLVELLKKRDELKELSKKMKELMKLEKELQLKEGYATSESDEEENEEMEHDLVVCEEENVAGKNNNDYGNTVLNSLMNPCYIDRIQEQAAKEFTKRQTSMEKELLAKVELLKTQEKEAEILMKEMNDLKELRNTLIQKKKMIEELEILESAENSNIKNAIHETKKLVESSTFKKQVRFTNENEEYISNKMKKFETLQRNHEFENKEQLKLLQEQEKDIQLLQLKMKELNDLKNQLLMVEEGFDYDSFNNFNDETKDQNDTTSEMIKEICLQNEKQDHSINLYEVIENLNIDEKIDAIKDPLEHEEEILSDQDNFSDDNDDHQENEPTFKISNEIKINHIPHYLNPTKISPEFKETEIIEIEMKTFKEMNDSKKIQNRVDLSEIMGNFSIDNLNNYTSFHRNKSLDHFDNHNDESEEEDDDLLGNKIESEIIKNQEKNKKRVDFSEIMEFDVNNLDNYTFFHQTKSFKHSSNDSEEENPQDSSSSNDSEEEENQDSSSSEKEINNEIIIKQQEQKIEKLLKELKYYKKLVHKQEGKENKLDRQETNKLDGKEMNLKYTLISEIPKYENENDFDLVTVIKKKETLTFSPEITKNEELKLNIPITVIKKKKSNVILLEKTIKEYEDNNCTHHHQQTHAKK